MIKPATIRSNANRGNGNLVDDLKAIRPSAFWRFLVRQPASFWLVCGYLFVEYFRPQTRFPALDVLPWGKGILFLSLAAMIAEGKLPKLRTAMGPLIVLFLGVVLASSMTAQYSHISFDAIDIIIAWILIYVIITNVVTTEGRFFIFTLLFILLSFKLSQHPTRNWLLGGFAFRGAGAWGPQGWFNNPGELGIQFCILLAVSAAFYWGLKDRLTSWGKAFFLFVPFSAVIGVIATNSRGAQLGVVALVAWLLVVVAPRVRTIVLAAVVASAGYFLIPERQMERWQEAGDDDTSVTRQERWADGRRMMSRHPVLGVGYANWLVYYRNHFPYRERQGLSHNIFIDVGAELGYVGFVSFLLLVGATFLLNWKTRKFVRGPPVSNRFLHAMAFGLDGALVSFLVTGFFVSVLYYPYFWVNLAMTVALHVVARQQLQAARASGPPRGARSRRRVRAGPAGGHGPIPISTAVVQPLR